MSKDTEEEFGWNETVGGDGVKNERDGGSEWRVAVRIGAASSMPTATAKSSVLGVLASR